MDEHGKQLPGHHMGGFADRALHAVPPWALGMIGTILGLAIALFIVIKLGGLDSSVQRVAGAYASMIEASVINPMEEHIARLEALANTAEDSEKRIAGIEDLMEKLAIQIHNVDMRLTQMETDHKVKR